MRNKILNQIDIYIESIISNWVRKNYGESEGDNPSWNVEGLAQEIAEHAYEIANKANRRQ